MVVGDLRSFRLSPGTPPRASHPSCRANLEPISQSRPDSGLGFQVKVLKIFKGVPSSLGSGLLGGGGGGWGLGNGDPERLIVEYRVASPMRNTHPRRITIDP